MSEPFPTKAEIEFFTSEEAKRIQEEWEPKVGDLCVFLNGWGDKGTLMLISQYRRFRFYLSGLIEEHDFLTNLKQLKAEFAWLPHQGQLQAMLEKRTQYLEMDNRGDKERYNVMFATTYLASDRKTVSGSTAAIALGRALLEVIQGGKK